MNLYLNFFLYAALPWILSMFTIAVTWMAGNKHRHAWVVGLVAQGFWILYIIGTEAWGLALGCIALVLVYSRNHFKWNAKTAEQEEADEFGVSTRNVRQANVAQWVREAFGVTCMADPQERVARVLEEAIELAQAEGLPMRTASALLRHTYRKQPGDPRDELGAVGLTLLAYAESRGFDADAAESAEVQRVLEMPIQYFKDRHLNKIDAGVARNDGVRAWQ